MICAAAVLLTTKTPRPDTMEPNPNTYPGPVVSSAIPVAPLASILVLLDVYDGENVAAAAASDQRAMRISIIESCMRTRCVCVCVTRACVWVGGTGSNTFVCCCGSEFDSTTCCENGVLQKKWSWVCAGTGKQPQCGVEAGMRRLDAPHIWSTVSSFGGWTLCGRRIPSCMMLQGSLHTHTHCNRANGGGVALSSRKVVPLHASP